MELIIKIPDEIYELIKTDKSELIGLPKAVKNGTPLPKGHGRLIDADELPIDIEWDDIEKAPTIIKADNS